MGKKKSCDVGMRRCILNLYERKWSYKKIAEHLKCSKTMVFNAVRHFQKYKTVENVRRKRRTRKTTRRTDAAIVRLSKKNSRLGSNQIRQELIAGTNEFNVSARTVRRRLNEAGLFGRVARKKPFINKRNRIKRTEFANNHKQWTINQWKFVLWSDETKINRFGSDGRQYVRRPRRKEFDPRYTEKTIKHGGGSIMVWACFSGNGVGPIHRIHGTMNKEMYQKILEDVMLPYAEENLPVVWRFQHDNDPKHSARSVKEWLAANAVTVLDWPSCSPDLNPIENLWNDVKNTLRQKHITNLDQLFTETVAAWQAIPKQRCIQLIESMGRRCEAVLRNKGFPTKY